MYRIFIFLCLQEEGREEIVIIDINMGLKFPGVEYLQDKVDHNISSTKPGEKLNFEDT